MNQEKCIDVCNELLRGELAAMETYGQALVKFQEPKEHQALQEIWNDHLHNAEVLREHLNAMGAAPVMSSGLWGNFAKVLESAASMLGHSPALGILKAGERYGISEYQHALEDKEVMSDIKTRISTDLLPSLSRHIHHLEMLAA